MLQGSLRTYLHRGNERFCKTAANEDYTIIHRPERNRETIRFFFLHLIIIFFFFPFLFIYLFNFFFVQLRSIVILFNFLASIHFFLFFCFGLFKFIVRRSRRQWNGGRNGIFFCHLKGRENALLFRLKKLECRSDVLMSVCLVEASAAIVEKFTETNRSGRKTKFHVYFFLLKYISDILEIFGFPRTLTLIIDPSAYEARKRLNKWLLFNQATLPPRPSQFSTRRLILNITCFASPSTTLEFSIILLSFSLVFNPG